MPTKPTKRTPSGARIRRRATPLPSVRQVPMMRLVRALTDATVNERITWDVDDGQATWPGTVVNSTTRRKAQVTVAWTLTPSGRTVKSAAMVVEERSVNIMVEVAMLDEVRVLAPLVWALVARHDEDVAAVIDGLLADIAGPVETVDAPIVPIAGEETPDVVDLRGRVTYTEVRESPGLLEAIRRMVWRG